MTEQKFTQLLLENQLNVDAETTLKWSIDTLINSYTRESGKNLSIEKAKEGKNTDWKGMEIGYYSFSNTYKEV